MRTRPREYAFSNPPGWKPAGATDVQFKFDNGNAHLTLDVPKLPALAAFGIPINRVVSGYEDDTKKRMPDAAATNLPDPGIADAQSKRVKLSGHQNGSTAINEAAMIVHASRVYILSIDCDDKFYPAAKAALDMAVQSLQWVK